MTGAPIQWTDEELQALTGLDADGNPTQALIAEIIGDAVDDPELMALLRAKAMKE